jgi:dTDP-4-dehydrorhamnose 3,5-epimerase
VDRLAKECERSIRWDDPALAIAWPLPRRMNASQVAPQVAPKDAAAPPLAGAELP